MEHLSNIDAAFLHLETPETPMHVGSLMLLDLPPGHQGDFYEEFKAMLAKRMHMASVLTRKLAPMPFELAEPVWIEDDDVDLDYHVRTHMLRPPGSMDQLRRLVARLHSSLLDRSRPLWEVYVIEGLASGQIGFYSKVHHSGIDGKAGAELARVLYDTSPEIREVTAPRRRRRAGRFDDYQLGVAELLQAAVNNSFKQYRKLFTLLPTAVRAVSVASRVAANQFLGGKERSLSLGLAPKTIFNEPITNQRSYATLSVPFQDLKALGKRVGGTVNTIVMCMCSEAVRGFLQARHALPAEPLIAGVPVSLRDEGNDAMNNQVSAVRVDLATDIADLGERFKAIHASSEAAKAVVRELKPVLGVDMPITGAPWIMTSLASLYGRSTLARDLPPVANLLISNVPGPPVPLYVAGARMRQYYPVSIPYHGNALNITVNSYGGTSLEFGIVACRRALTQEEVQELAERLEQALEKIKRLPDAVPAPAAEAAASPAPAPAARQRAAPKRAAKKPAAAQAAAARRADAAAPAKKASEKKTSAKKPPAKKTAGKKAAARPPAMARAAAQASATGADAAAAPAAP
ncbi:MAG: wax ester/triacylglycerol synthase family O-acyltransferase [Pseudomonadota bacterium]|nr:wax ester/triacylglycerol synthase family O-acyltransferase [Pseudomonadota bacterium]